MKLLNWDSVYGIYPHDSKGVERVRITLLNHVMDRSSTLQALFKALLGPYIDSRMYEFPLSRTEGNIIYRLALLLSDEQRRSIELSQHATLEYWITEWESSYTDPSKITVMVGNPPRMELPTV